MDECLQDCANCVCSAVQEKGWWERYLVKCKIYRTRIPSAIWNKVRIDRTSSRYNYKLKPLLLMPAHDCLPLTPDHGLIPPTEDHTEISLSSVSINLPNMRLYFAVSLPFLKSEFQGKSEPKVSALGQSLSRTGGTTLGKCWHLEHLVCLERRTWAPDKMVSERRGNEMSRGGEWGDAMICHYMSNPNPWPSTCEK